MENLNLNCEEGLGLSGRAYAPVSPFNWLLLLPLRRSGNHLDGRVTETKVAELCLVESPREITINCYRVTSLREGISQGSRLGHANLAEELTIAAAEAITGTATDRTSNPSV